MPILKKNAHCQSKGLCQLYISEEQIFIQLYPVSEGYLRKILVERRGKFPKRRAKFAVLETGIFRK